MVEYAEPVKQFLVDIDSVQEYPDNPRRGDVDALVDSIRVNGFYTVALAQRSTGYLVMGNHRRKALLKMGATQIPVMYKDMSDEDALRIVLADNRTSDLSYYDDPTLFALLDQLNGDFSGTGYDKASYELLLQGLEGDSMLGNINQGNMPSDRLEAWAGMDIRNIVLPYEGDEYDEVAGGLIALRSAWSLETNADVVARLVAEALVSQG